MVRESPCVIARAPDASPTLVECMYERYYRLARAPFDIAPNPAFLFATPSHSEALATIAYGIEKRKGFIVLTGEVGLGKTTLLRAYLDQADRAGLDLAYVLHPAIEFKDLLVVIGDEIGLELKSDRSLFELIDTIQHRLIERYRAGRNMAIIVDEAQRLPESTLENLRLLSNLETEHDKLIQIVLVGQPELDDFLNRTEMRQLAQRVALRARLKPLDVGDSVAYLHHRLRLAGAKYPEKVLAPGAMKKLAVEARGVPRVLNILADNTLITGFALQRQPVPVSVVDDVVDEYYGRPKRRGATARWLVPAAAAGVVAVGAAALALSPAPLNRVKEMVAVPSLPATDGDGSAGAASQAMKPALTPPPSAAAVMPPEAPKPPALQPAARPSATAKTETPRGTAGIEGSAGLSPPAAPTAAPAATYTPPAPAAEPAPSVAAPAVPVAPAPVAPAAPAAAPAPSTAPGAGTVAAAANMPPDTRYHSGIETQPLPPPVASTAPVTSGDTQRLAALQPPATTAPAAAEAPPPSALTPAQVPPAGTPAAELAPPAPKPNTGERVHVVRLGDTLYQLVLDEYGIWNARTRDLVLRRNPAVTNSNVLWVGQVLTFPARPPDLPAVASARAGAG
jgi:general secretion pathway protein A